jgi:hypothetical protein
VANLNPNGSICQLKFGIEIIFHEATTANIRLATQWWTITTNQKGRGREGLNKMVELQEKLGYDLKIITEFFS